MRASVAALAALLGGAVLLPSAAGAAVGHTFVQAFGETRAQSALLEPGAEAVDHETGDVFVADNGRGVVDVFSSTGTYLTSFGGDVEAGGLAVDEATGDVFVAEPFEGVVLVFGPDGSGGYALASRWTGAHVPGGSFGGGEVVGVAVDNSTSVSDPSAGDVYVVDSEGAPLNKGETKFAAAEVLKPGPGGEEGEFVRDVVGKGLEEPSGVVVDSATGRVYIAAGEQGAIEAFSSAGVFEARLKGAGSPFGPFEEGDVGAMAVDEGNGDLLVVDPEHDLVSELNGAGEWVGWVTGTPVGPFGEARGVAVGASEDVYVADGSADVVDVFGPGVTVPDVTVKVPENVTGTGATLRGVVDGEGEAVSYHFEVGETESYAGSGTAVMQTHGGGEEHVQASITGLKPATKYYFRLVGEDKGGASCSVGLVFATEGAEATGQASSAACTGPRATVDGESVTEVGAIEATLRAQIDPREHQTTAYFLYGSESCAGDSSRCASAPQPPRQLGSADSDVPVSVVLHELQPDTTYHYRVIASDSLGVSEGIERTFTTHAASPAVLPDGRAWEMVSPRTSRARRSKHCRAKRG